MAAYIYRDILDDVADVFDARSIWHTPGLSLFPKKPQLKEVLQRLPRQQKGRNMTRCFSHICLLLPQSLLEEDALLYRGSHQRELVQQITALHETDFAPFLLDDAGRPCEVRYQILPEASLSERQIGVKFGHAFYLPGDEEEPQYQLSYSSDSVIWQQMGALYPQQRLALLGDYPYEHADQLSGWPAALGGSLLLINDGPGSKLQLQAQPFDAFDIRQDEPSGNYILNAKGNRAGVELGQARRLLLKVQPVQKTARKPMPQATSQATSRPTPDAKPPTMPPAMPHTVQAAGTEKPIQPAPNQATPRPTASAPKVWQARPPAAAAETCNKPTDTAPPANLRPAPLRAISNNRANNQTGRPTPDPAILQPATKPVPATAQADSDLTYIPVSTSKQSSISLVALALPRLSRYPDAGVNQIEIIFGADMRLQTHNSHSRLLTLRVDSKDQIDIRSSSGQQTITAPARFEPIAGRNLNLLTVSGAMQELYCACVQLPHHPKATLPTQTRHHFGRGTPAFAHLRVLEQTNNKTCQPDRIGLSRKAFAIECESTGFDIWREAEHQTLFHLDQDFQLVAAITSAPYRMPSGHHLVAGNYVLRLDL